MTTKGQAVGFTLRVLVGLLAAAVIAVACGGATPPAVPPAPIASVALEVPSAPPAPPPVPSDEGAAVPVSVRDPQWGKPDALVTIVMFGDLQGPFGARAEPTVRRVCDTYGPNQVRLVWKNNPLPYHQNARAAAEAAMAVFGLKGSEAFWAFHDRAFANQQALSDDSFVEWASESEVDPRELKDALASKKYSPKIDEDVALATQLGIRDDPAFRVNGFAIAGAQPFEKFQAVIDAQLAQARAALASGTPKSELYAAQTNKNHADELVQVKAVQQEASAEDKGAWKVPILADDPVRGPSGALVTVVEFADFQCPFCKRVQDTLSQLSAMYGSEIRFVWKDNPLPFHPRARPAATLARVAYKQHGDKGFWDAHDRLFAKSPKLEDDDLRGIAQAVGVSWAAAKQASESGRFAAKFDADAQLARDLNAPGTPSFFINGVRLVGAYPIDKFKEVIDEQLATAKGIVAGGVPRAGVYDEIMKRGRDYTSPSTPAAAPAANGTDAIEASHLLVQYQGALRAPSSITRSKVEARTRAEQALAKLKQGADFARVAAEYSDEPGAAARGGALGSFGHAQMIKPFEEAAFALKVNELSGIVETAFGFHVIKRTK